MTAAAVPRPTRRRTALALGVLFALLAGTVVTRHGAPLGPDLSLHRWALRHRHESVTTAAVAWTTTGTGLFAYGAATVAGAVGRRDRRARCRGGALAAVGLAAGQLVRVGLVEGVGRPRPPLGDWASHAAGPALPSGHTTTSALVASIVCLAVHRAVIRQGPRVVGCAAALLWAVGVGGTRVYLGVHWPTDVLAGWLLAGFLTCSVLSWPWTGERRIGVDTLLPDAGPPA